VQPECGHLEGGLDGTCEGGLGVEGGVSGGGEGIGGHALC